MARRNKAVEELEEAVEQAGIEPEIEDIKEAETAVIEVPVTIERRKTQAEIDLSILLQAQEIRQDAERFKAARAIAGAHNIG